MLYGGVCALAFGISVTAAVIDSMKNIEIARATILFLNVFILFFLP
jgi:hypothetical protein